MDSAQIELNGELKAFLNSSHRPEVVRAMLDGFSAIYRGFLAEHYMENSRGGGEWPPLSWVTIRARRRRRKAGGEKILLDTGYLKNAVSVQTGVQAVPKFGPGGRNEVRIDDSSVVIGFSSAAHPGKGTIDEIAEAHQQGAGHLPQREIIIEPSEKTLGEMARYAEALLVNSR